MGSHPGSSQERTASVGAVSSEAPLQPRSSIPRKPVPFTTMNDVTSAETDKNFPEAEQQSPEPSTVRRRVYWATPVAAAVLFLLGLGAAIGHCVYFSQIKDTHVGDQTWTVRYSLALSFIFKSALSACISIALAQHVWFKLRNRTKGTTIVAIDAMFLSSSSLSSFLSPCLWRSAITAGLMAACIWLMPVTALVAPTALTVGTSVSIVTYSGCTVPSLDWGVTRDSTISTEARALFVTDNSDNLFHPSTESRRLTASVLNNGRQIGWPSPCGRNCTYDIDFVGPSWQCTQSEDVDDPRATWKAQFSGSYWYWGYGDGSNITVTETNVNGLLYNPVYSAGLNASTNQFWAAFAAGFTRGLDPSEGLLGQSLREILDVQAYYCQVTNTSYSLRVSYENGNQNNTLLKIDPFSTFEISPEGWNGQGRYTASAGDPSGQLPIPLQDVVGLYSPMINALSGYIKRDPRYELVSNTSLGTVPSLITDLPLNVTYASETPFIPRRDLGNLLQQLSFNLTISLMSDPSLLVTNSAQVQCQKTLTQTVWKVDWLPIIVAYSAGIGATLICLGFGIHGLIVNGVAHDTSFSSVMRTTRNSELDTLVSPEDSGALPLAVQVREQRLRFLDNSREGHSGEALTRSRAGFVLEQ